MRTQLQEKARAETIAKLAERAGLVVATANTRSGMFYFLVDGAGAVRYRFRPDSVVFNADGMSPDDVLARLFTPKGSPRSL